MTEQQLKDTIIAQAVRIAELEEELASENWMSNYYRKECSELRDKIAKLKEELGEVETPFADHPVEDLEATND